jgi:hypothetical protein
MDMDGPPVVIADYGSSQGKKFGGSYESKKQKTGFFLVQVRFLIR